MPNLAQLSVMNLPQLSEAIDTCAKDARSMEEAAQQIVQGLHAIFVDDKGQPSCALIRCFKTHRYDHLPFELRESAQSIQSDIADVPGAKCLVLMGSAGIEPQWNSRRSSTGHQAIPLPSPKIVGRFPMISQVMIQLGVDVSRVLRPNDDLIVDMHERTYNVFYVEEAQGSPHIPAQEQFVKPYGIQSVVGFGGILPSGDLCIVILFSRVRLERNKAELFKPLAVTVKSALLPFETGDVFSREMPVNAR